MQRGAADAAVMFIGLAPGASAIGAQQAFAGNSMARLRSWISEAGLDLTEEECRAKFYFTSVVKCAVSPDSPGNRKVLWGNCHPFLWQQINFVAPKLIVLLGSESIGFVLRTRDHAMTDVVGRIWKTADVFAEELFRPVEIDATWLGMPHPSGLSRLMNDSNIKSRAIAALNACLDDAGLLA